MDPLALDLLMARFDNLEKLIREGQTDLEAHKQDDLKVAEVVTKHSAYWKLLTYITGGLFGALIAWIGAHWK